MGEALITREGRSRARSCWRQKRAQVGLSGTTSL